MRTLSTWIVMATVLLLSGCGVFRSIEQWKCDRFGICQFGTKPSQPVPYANEWQPVAPEAPMTVVE